MPGTLSSEENCLIINVEDYLVWGGRIRIHHLQHLGSACADAAPRELTVSAVTPRASPNCLV